MSIKELVERGIELVTCKHRGNIKHQASMCIICDCFIIGIETLHKLPKEHILENSRRLSIEIYQEFYNGEELDTQFLFNNIMWLDCLVFYCLQERKEMGIRLSVAGNAFQA